jgi:carbon storage regulator
VWFVRVDESAPKETLASGRRVQGRKPTMLVLSRQRDESIKIGDDIEITVVDIRGEKVRLGINAPSHVPVHRKEVYEAIKRENEAAAQARGEPPGKVESLAKRKQRDTDKQAEGEKKAEQPPAEKDE